MSRTEARWLGAVLFVGAGLLGAPGCAGDTTNNYAACGPGTRHDPDLNACVPIDGDAGAGDAGAGSGGAAGASGASGSAGTSQAGSAGVGGTLPDAGDASQQEDAPAPDPNDDACLTTGVFIVNGDKACGTYNPVGVCSGTEPNTIELPELTEEDIALTDPWDPTTGGVWVRTPSHPGANAACGDGCSRPGTIARIRIPIRHVGYPKPLTLVVVHEDETNSIAPWHISEAVINEYCANETDYECWATYVTESNILIETDDPEAPARNFHIYEVVEYSGACNEYL